MIFSLRTAQCRTIDIQRESVRHDTRCITIKRRDIGVCRQLPGAGAIERHSNSANLGRDCCTFGILNLAVDAACKCRTIRKVQRELRIIADLDNAVQLLPVCIECSDITAAAPAVRTDREQDCALQALYFVNGRVAASLRRLVTFELRLFTRLKGDVCWLFFI